MLCSFFRPRYPLSIRLTLLYASDSSPLAISSAGRCVQIHSDGLVLRSRSHCIHSSASMFFSWNKADVRRSDRIVKSRRDFNSPPASRQRHSADAPRSSDRNFKPAGFETRERGIDRMTKHWKAAVFMGAPEDFWEPSWDVQDCHHEESCSCPSRDPADLQGSAEDH